VNQIGAARGIALVAPRREFTGGEVNDLLEYEKTGGVVMLAVGAPDAGPVAALLNAHGVRLHPTPLGRTSSRTQDGRANKEEPRFLDPWPIIAETDKVEVIYENGGNLLACFCKVGEGGLLLISDSRFFSATNVERYPVHKWEGNIRFVRGLFDKYLRTDSSSVKALFASPEKPR